jgi:hypothetical protein
MWAFTVDINKESYGMRAPTKHVAVYYAPDANIICVYQHMLRMARRF